MDVLHEVSVDTLKDYITTTLCDYCNFAEYDVKANTDTFVLTSGLGPHGTVFLRSYMAGLMAGCLKETVPVEALGSTIRFTGPSDAHQPVGRFEAKD